MPKEKEGTGALADPRVQELFEKVEKIDEKKREKAIRFSIDDFLVGETEEIEVEELGTVKYKMIDTGEFLEIMRNPDKKDQYDLALTALYKMLSKADSNITFEKIKRLKPKVAFKLIEKLLPFLV